MHAHQVATLGASATLPTATASLARPVGVIAVEVGRGRLNGRLDRSAVLTALAALSTGGLVVLAALAAPLSVLATLSTLPASAATAATAAIGTLTVV